MPIKSICVFCGSKPGHVSDYAQQAFDLGKILAETGIKLVYGGGHSGLMGMVADGCLTFSGDVTGVIPDFLSRVEMAHKNVKNMHIVSCMHTRKRMMGELSDAFIILPGGVGTMEELFEVWSWSQLGQHRKPIGLLNIKAYYTPLLTFMDKMRDQGFIAAKHRDLLITHDNPSEIIELIKNFEHPGAVIDLEGNRAKH